jgi:hypothetical protein
LLAWVFVNEFVDSEEISFEYHLNIRFIL